MPELIYTVASVMQAVENRLKDSANLAVLDAAVQEFQSNASSIYIRRGKAKVEDRYPCIALEINSKKEPWGAINYTKEITVSVDIYGMVKVTGGKASEKISLAVEDYIIKLGETLQGILNERKNIQYNNIDGQNAHIYNSYAESADYLWLYQGAVRAVKLQWFGQLWLFGSPPNEFST